jgi:hypothetical protein
MIRFAATTVLVLALVGPAQGIDFVAAPDGDDNLECTEARPCSPQGAVNACPDGNICNIKLQPGIYLDPAVNITYHRLISLMGDCNDANAVILRSTKPGTVLVWVQDHAIGTVSCVEMDSESSGTIGISARQHTIVDYDRVIFGAMRGGMHVAMTQFSIANCSESVWIKGDAQMHVRATYNSQLNLGCSITLTEPRAFTYFVSAQAFSIIDAQNAKFFGSATGVGCYSWNAIVHLPAQGFPGSEPGNC